LARALSKLGFCSRSQAWKLIEAGRVRLNGAMVRDPEHRVLLTRDRIEVDGVLVKASEKVHLMLNKPRGLVTTTSDEKGRETVYKCLEGSGLPNAVPVGRLDQASEGLLLFTNDTAWAAAITDPANKVQKTYHVQVDCIPTSESLREMEKGRESDGEWLRVDSATLLRSGTTNSWLEFKLSEGRNRHLRRLLAAFGIDVLRLMRVTIGKLVLGNLAKGAWRPLTKAEVEEFSRLVRG
jgi:23S rRNA pseudouridine2605 synthase